VTQSAPFRVAVMLNWAQFCQGALGRERGVAGAQASAHDAVQDQDDEADRSVGAEAFRQSMIDRAASSLAFGWARRTYHDHQL
jgi:hypothetical protein